MPMMAIITPWIAPKALRPKYSAWMVSLRVITPPYPGPKMMMNRIACQRLLTMARRRSPTACRRSPNPKRYLVVTRVLSQPNPNLPPTLTITRREATRLAISRLKWTLIRYGITWTITACTVPLDSIIIRVRSQNALVFRACRRPKSSGSLVWVSLLGFLEGDPDDFSPSGRRP